MSTETTGVTEVTPPTEVETDTRTYRVLRYEAIDGRDTWEELGAISTRYTPDATEVGEAYGEGDYLLIEVDSRYSFHSTYPMRVVAEKRFREAREDEALT